MELITSRAVVGAMKAAFSAGMPPAWVGLVANTFSSDQDTEEYPWLSSTPAMREWVGGRNAKGFTENPLSIKNRHFEDTVIVQKKDLRRDKFGMIQLRIGELTRRAMAHPAALISQLMLNGAASPCYDGQYFFDTDHSQGDSGSQSNSLSIDISTLPVATGGSVTAPAVGQVQLCIGAAIAAMTGFKDDAGEPANEDASGFLVMCGPSLMQPVMQAVATPAQVAESQTVLTALKADFTIGALPNARLSTWTDKFVVLRTDSLIKPFIFQRETAINISAKAEGSDFEHDNDAHEYGVDYWGNAAYGLWQHAVLVTMT